jgi:RNA polymerase sigma-70 factor, ECF subfamily
MPIFPAARFAKLLTEARNGCSEALGRLLEPFRMHLYAPGQKLHPALAGQIDKAELLQETLHIAIRNFKQFQGNSEGQLLMWLREIMNRRILNLNRHYLQAQKRDVRRQVSLEEDFLGSAFRDVIFDNEATPFTAMSRRERTDIMHQAFEVLPDECQEIIRLKHGDGKSFEEIGEMYRCTAKAAAKRWREALSAWRHAMQDMGLSDWSS